MALRAHMAGVKRNVQMKAKNSKQACLWGLVAFRTETNPKINTGMEAQMPTATHVQMSTLGLQMEGVVPLDDDPQPWFLT
jgi:hypothetical protein